MDLNATVLIVDDDPGLRLALKDRFEHWGCRVSEAAEGREALAACAKTQFDLIVLDLTMPGMSGLEVLDRLAADECEADGVVLTAHGSVGMAVQALQKGAADFLTKPADFDLLAQVATRARDKRKLQRSCAALAARFIAVAREVAANLNLVADPYVFYLVANVQVIGDQVIIGNLLHVERLPGLLVPGLKVAGEYTVPELDLVQQLAGRCITPDHADIHHIQVVIGPKVHTAVAVVVPVRHNHASERVLVFGFDPVVDAVIGGVEGSLAGLRLSRLFENFRTKIDIAWQSVPVPERHKQHHEARQDR